MIRLFFGIILLSLFKWNLAISQDLQNEMLAKLVCVESQSCGECLAAAKHCRWCADPDFATNGTPRCFDENGLKAANCSQSSIQRPRLSSVEVLQANSSSDWLPDKPAVQLTPQKVKISLRPKESQTISLSYRPAKNYPLDLYFLMDLTISMRDDKDTLVSLSDDIPKAMKNLTEYFRVGFGSFADKPMMPFTRIGSRENPCRVINEECEPIYSFRHHLSLTENINDFIQRVNESSVTANLDNAESGLEALLQAAVCGDAIGWRDVSRKIVIVLTDGFLHQAGDGILGGLTKLNDEKCHLDELGFYTASEDFDYPSFNQMYRILTQHKMNVIFAVTEEVKKHYDGLHGIWSDNTYIGRLEADSSNILNLIKKGYEDIASVVDLQPAVTQGPKIRVDMSSDCGEGGRCTGVSYGQTYDFDVKFTLDECPKYEQGQKTLITIQETHLGQDFLEVEVELLCGCPCEDNEELNKHIKCPQNANMKCGQCQCTNDWKGPNCECRLSDDTAFQLVNSCIENATASDLGTIRPACSSAGDCICGECLCDPGFSGKYCQCPRCPISGLSRMECGGGERGFCECGECHCHSGWNGTTCDCTTDTTKCVAPLDREKSKQTICSKRGECKCGKCECHRSNNQIAATGEWCEVCTNCENPVCAQASACVNCYALHTNKDDCIKNCTGVLSYSVNMNITDEELKQINKKKLTLCVTRYERDDRICETQFAYGPDVPRPEGSDDDTSIPLLIMDEVCQQPRAATLFLGGLVISLMVVGVGLVVATIVKISTVISERREYSKWKAEADAAAMNPKEENPLYISPITSYKLPSDYPRNKFE